jgi:DNA-binding transcriptional LysR family regulator
VAPLLQGLHVFESNLRLLAVGQGGTLKVGMAPLLASQVAPRFAEAFFAPGSKAQLRVMVRSGTELLEALKSDQIELFFYPETHVSPTEEIETDLVGHITPTCVVRSGHPLLQRERLSLEDLQEFPWASSMEHPVGPDLPNAADMVCDNYHILREAVLATDLICICSTEFIAAELHLGSLVALKVNDLPMPATAIYVAKLRGRMNSPLAQAALTRVNQYLSG